MLTLMRAILIAALPAAGAEAPIAAPHFVLAVPENFPLKETRTEVSISGVIASIRSTQTYENTGPTNIEAIYVFPGGARAALHAVEIEVGGRKTVARIFPKRKAQELYESAKNSGLTAALVKQHRPNVFETNVANIRPRDVVRVVIEWSLLLVPEEGEYELALPAVVGPRYVSKEETHHLEPGPEDAHNPSGAKFVADPSDSSGAKFVADPNDADRAKFVADPSDADRAKFVADPNDADRAKFVADPNDPDGAKFVADPSDSSGAKFVADPSGAKFVADPNDADRAKFVADPSDPSGAKFVANTKYASEGERTFFDLDVHLEAGMKIAEIHSPSHPVQRISRGETAADIVIDSADTNPGDRDFVLRYRLAGDRINTGLLLYEDPRHEENFFLLMLEPPKKIEPNEIPPREYIFIIDVSGSMRGFPLDLSKTLMRTLLATLRPFDRFNVVLFAGGPGIIFNESRQATATNIAEAKQIIDQQTGGGGTELRAAITAAMALPRPAMPIARTLVLLTDGYVTVEAEVLKEIRTRLQDASFFAFGIGGSVNRHLIESVARAGMGEPEVVLTAEEARAKSDRFVRRISAPLLTETKLTFENFDAYDLEPTSIPDLYAEHPVIVFGKYRGKPQGAIKLRGTTGTGTFERRITIKPDSTTNRAIRWLWARDRVAGLEDRSALGHRAELTEEIERLGLAYELVTSQTSFLAVDDQKRGDGTTPTRVIQPIEETKTAALYRGKTIIDLSDATVQGELTKPEGSYILNRRAEEKRDEAIGELRKLLPTPKPKDEIDMSLEAKIDQLKIEGPLDEKLARAAIEKRLAALAECSVKAGAKFAIDLAIDTRGRVFGVAVRGDKAAKFCLARRLEHMRIDSAIELEASSLLRIELTLIDTPKPKARTPLRTGFGTDEDEELE